MARRAPDAGDHPLRVLFLCSRNRRRSPTAESLFSGDPNLDVTSAGLAPDAEEVVTPDLLEWAELIVVMERRHRVQLQQRFGAHLRDTRIVCVEIADNYEFMDEALQALLLARLTPLLTSRRRG